MKPITLTEKRFFEWHEDDVSVTLRNKSGSYVGGSEVLVIAENQPVAFGLDTYNQSVSEETICPLRAHDGGDTTPKVVVLEGNGNRPSHRGDGYSESDIMYTLNSTEVHGVAMETR